MAIQHLLNNHNTPLNYFLEEATDIVVICDKEGSCRYIGPNCKRILGKPAEAFIGKNTLDFVHFSEKRKVKLQLALASVKRIKIDPFRLKMFSSSERWFEAIVIDLRREPGIAALLIRLHEVTEQIASQTRIKQCAERYNRLVQATSDIFWDWDLLGNTITLGEKIGGILGHKAGAHDVGWWHNLIHPSDTMRIMKGLSHHIDQKKNAWSTRYRIQCANGVYKIFRHKGYLIYNEKGKPVRMIGALQNITIQEEQQDLLKQQNDSLLKIAWLHAHVVREPLARIIALKDLLCALDTDEETKKILLGHMNTSVLELDQVIKKIINMTQNVVKSVKAR